MNGPLEGVKIIDLTSMISGPSATMILADQGAEVVKIENTLLHLRMLAFILILVKLLAW